MAPAPEPRAPDGPPVVTGLGIVSPIGIGVAAFWSSLAGGEHGIRVVDRFSTERYRAHLAGTISSAWMAAHASPDGALDPAAAIAIVAAREAWQDAELDGVDRARIAVVLGTSAGGFTSRARFELPAELDLAARYAAFSRSAGHAQTAAVAEAMGALGPRVTVSTACTSSTHAIGSARFLLEAGDADVALVIGVDVLIEAIFAGFHAMGAMSQGPCAPFSAPSGMTTGEGAGVVILEAARSAAARGARVRGFVNGFAASSDAFHATAADPTGRGLGRALAGALADAGLDPADVGWVSAHGTGTDTNDAAEWRALRRVFGDRAGAVPVSATKSFFGHALGGAGALELAAALLALEHQVVPCTLHHRAPRFSDPIDSVPGTRPRALEHLHVLKAASGFGGVNAAVVVSRVPSARPRPPEDEVVVLGRSSSAAPGEDLAAADDAWLDPRDVDCLGRRLAVLANAALGDAGVRVRGALHDRAGIVVGAPTLSWDSNQEFWDSLRARGTLGVSVPAFSRMVMNAPAGAASRALGLRGHAQVLASGAISGALAAVEATRLLRGATGLDMLVVGSVSAIDESLLWGHALRHPSGAPRLGQGAACLVLARRGWAVERQARRLGRIVATSVGGPGQLEGTVARALDLALRRPDVVVLAHDGTARGHAAAASALDANDVGSVPRTDPGIALGYGDSNDACALAEAVERLAEPGVGAALVLAFAEEVGAVAIVVARDA